MQEYYPSGFLFPISTLNKHSAEAVADVLKRLQCIFRHRGSTDPVMITDQVKAVQLSKITANISAKRGNNEQDLVTDSGYASAEEDDEKITGSGTVEDEDAQDIFNVIRNDPFERDSVVRWLTGFVARSSSWIYSYSDDLSADESEEREVLVEVAASLLTSYAGADEEDEALVRRFEFPIDKDDDLVGTSVTVELNDAPLLSADHSSVGLQSWASSIIFARLLCQRPKAFGLQLIPGRKLRILELGAGTGLLSIVSSKILAAYRDSHCYASEIVATDYHPDVLTNLGQNVDSNITSEDTAISVTKFDWQYPSTNPPFDREFDIILAADVIYNPCHAKWIKSCVSRLLKRPSKSSTGGWFWMAIPIRTTGRHEGLHSTVLDMFPLAPDDNKIISGDNDLKTTMVQDLARYDGVGRADEAGYRLFKICWV